jgi:hypothetical protein
LRGLSYSRRSNFIFCLLNRDKNHHSNKLANELVLFHLREETFAAGLAMFVAPLHSLPFLRSLFVKKISFRFLLRIYNRFPGWSIGFELFLISV